MSKGKTYKREVATGLLILMGYISVIGNAEILQIIIWPIMLFASAAFGLDWAWKQGNEIVTRLPPDRTTDRM